MKRKYEYKEYNKEGEVYYICQDCGKEILEGEEWPVDDDVVCEDCIGKYSYCAVCDGFFSDDGFAEEHLCFYCRDREKIFKKMI